jgi:hypothetical protein
VRATDYISLFIFHLFLGVTSSFYKFRNAYSRFLPTGSAGPEDAAVPEPQVVPAAHTAYAGDQFDSFSILAEKFLAIFLSHVTHLMDS